MSHGSVARETMSKRPVRNRSMYNRAMGKSMSEVAVLEMTMVVEAVPEAEAEYRSTIEERRISIRIERIRIRVRVRRIRIIAICGRWFRVDRGLLIDGCAL